MSFPRPEYLLKKIAIKAPLIGLYDATSPEDYAPLTAPAKGRWACVFMFYNSWLQGESLHLTADNYGCGGAGTYLLGIKTRSREDYIDFLHGTEGLKASPEIMGEWIDHAKPYQPQNKNLIIGPLKDENYDQLKTVTFLINPDQLSMLITGAWYKHRAGEPDKVKAPFASGCGLMAPFFEDLNIPQAIIGGTDIAMRKYLPQDIIAFTVTRTMYEQLCALDENSFLDKPFWKDVLKKRRQEKKAC